MSQRHHDPHGHGPGAAPDRPVELQTWSWGEVFDVEIPSDWIVEPHTGGPWGERDEGGEGATGGERAERAADAGADHVHLVELYPVAQASTVAHIALLEPAPPVEGAGGLAELVRAFAAARGASEVPEVELSVGLGARARGGHAGGGAMARATFDGEGGRWVVYAATWGGAGAWMTACGHADEADHLATARGIFESLTAHEILDPLAAEEDGSF